MLKNVVPLFVEASGANKHDMAGKKVYILALPTEPLPNFSVAAAVVGTDSNNEESE